MGSGNTFHSGATSAAPSISMAFSESGGWSWFRGGPAKGDELPPEDHWSEDKEKSASWAVSDDVPEHRSVPSGLASPQMTQEAAVAAAAAVDKAGDNIGVNIFSSSLPDLFRNKLGLLDVQQPPSSEADEEPEDNEIPLEELELHAIGSLLPDDDELLAGALTDMPPGSSSTQDSEDLDFFSNGGGLELDGDGFSAEEPTSRTIFVRNIDSKVSDDELRAVFERFGDIRTLYTGCKPEGLILVSYYDLRGAKRAIRALQSRVLWGQKLEMHFLFPKDSHPYDTSLGMVAVFNVDPAVSNDDLKELFGVYGDIKEVHETPLKHRHRFIEFYDSRAACAALRVLNKRDLLARRTRLDPSSILQFNDDVDNDDPLVQSQHLFNATGYSESEALRELHQQAKFASFSHPWNSLAGGLSSPSSVMGKAGDVGLGYHSYPDFDYGLMNHIRQSSAMSALRAREGLEEMPLHRSPGYEHRGLAVNPRPGLVTTPSSPFLWGNAPQSSPLLWPPSAHLYGHPKVHGCSLQSHLLNPVLAYPQVGCLPYGEKLRDRRRGYLRQSAPGGYLGLTGSLRLGSRSHPDRKSDLSKGALSSGVGRFNSRHRSRRGDSNAADKEQFHLDLDRIVSGEDKRTTLMLKNIPNKYTSKMLLAVIDEANQGTYDFIYLPIDFKNKCNVGYAFVNMIEPSYIVSFYKAFNGKKWEKFNSEKVASVAYARIQGKAALVAHFQNSSLMNECRPIVFGEEGNTPDDPGKEIGIVMGSEEATKL
ncbi:hypothetical protein SELMODRAFT_438348 [Selaginella moellendorffii]|uniref:RRM domain-containing protein n=1 Tax=Selaginella moellendorffii TaxID=88036 RepID=D8QWC6_SELML|nr:protein MEI2-like 3 [Selaginella moellendorffii]EFJ36208.1 hypothetical protein SELMODRAFT_438348 [Selaginella moellendorffii]|eukprot:XP_002962745.1 protein MEI2-like 3 [Selaginella moellendorffii]